MHAQWTTNSLDIYNTNSGEVGIGINAPTSKLDVQASNPSLIKMRNSSTTNSSVNLDFSPYNWLHAWRLVAGSTGDPWSTNGQFYFANFYGIPIVTLTQEGNLGIGTSNPACRLDLSSNSIPLMQVKNTSTSGDRSSFIDIGSSVSGHSWRIGMGSTGTSYSGLDQGQFILRNNAGVVNFTMAQNGYVGLGTISPAYNLDVVGQVRFKNSNGIFEFYPETGDFEIGNGTSGYSHIDFKGSSNLSQDFMGRLIYYDSEGFRFISDKGTAAYNTMSFSKDGKLGLGLLNPSARFEVILPVTSSPVSGIYIQSNGFTNSTNAIASSFFKVNDGASEFFRIDGSGRVFIGNPPINTNYSTSLYRLFVKDGILTEKVKVAISSTSDWSDYVFEKDYNLMPLDSVEQFIDSNGHLPNVPSAQCVVSEGIDLGKMDATLLQKIEELTLYVIDLNKEIIRLKEELNQVKSK